MINPQDVYQFCEQMRFNYNAGFFQTPIHNGVKITGEYYTRSGQLLSMVITMYSNKVEIRVYDSAKRMIFTETTKGNINNNTRLLNFINHSINQY